MALERYGARRRIEDLADQGVPPLPRLRGHFEFLRDEVLRHGFTRGCMFGNFGAEIVDHSDSSGRRCVTGSSSGRTRSRRRWSRRKRRARFGPTSTRRGRPSFLLSSWEGTLIKSRADHTSDAFDAFFAVTFDALLSSRR